MTLENDPTHPTIVNCPECDQECYEFELEEFTVCRSCWDELGEDQQNDVLDQLENSDPRNW